MQIGMVGLGRMGANMTSRLIKGGHQVVGFALHRTAVDSVAKEGAIPAYTLDEAVKKLSVPRAIWIMVPSGAPTEDTIVALSKEEAIQRRRDSQRVRLEQADRSRQTTSQGES